MDILEMTNQILVLAEKHNDLELMTQIYTLQNGIKDLQTKLELNPEEHNHTLSSMIQWGHFTSNND